MTAETPECRCLGCRHKLSALGALEDGHRPSAGDLTVCFRCGAVMALGPDLTVRGLTDAEIAGIESDPETLRELAHTVRWVYLTRHQAG